MRLFFLIIAIHFVIGGLGIHLLNLKLAAEARKMNWRKYIFYLLIFIIVLASILINKNAFLGISIIILSASLLELLSISRLPCRIPSRNRIVFLSLAIFSVLTLFFSLFIFLPSVIIAYVYTLVIIFDGASQITGHALGKRKILPILSPNKTWEGLIGGTLSTVITAVVLHRFAGFSVSQTFIFGIFVCLVSFLGDLAASAFKRFFNTKDFGVILPGQGGILDRFDSFIASGALVGFAGILIYSSHFQIDWNIAVYLGYSMVFMIILLIGELIQNRYNLKPEYSRMFSHVMAGLACLFMISLFTSQWYIISICIQSALFLYITKRMGLFSSHHKVVRKTNGSSIFFIGILAAYFLSEMKSDIALYIIPVTVLTISDPVASVTGLNRRSGFWPDLSGGQGSSKTYIGSIGFFISAFIIILAGLSFFYAFAKLQLIIIAFSLSVITTITEVVSPEGTDNLSLPLVLSISLIIFTG
jgi:phosphatidate cytidylyltransferase